MRARVTAGEDTGLIGVVLSLLPDRGLLQLEGSGLLRVVDRSDLEFLPVGVSGDE